MGRSEVKEFWEKRALEHGASQTATHKDIFQRELEIASISNYLRAGDRVLDIGCGNGFSTRQFAGKVGRIVGMDYSEAMIAEARSQDAPSNVEFERADVLGLNPATLGLFDAAVTERCLINLDSWESQQTAVRNIHSVLKPGGRFIFCEGSSGGRAGLNRLRTSLGLPAMPTVWHNIDFDRNKTLDLMSDLFTVEDEISFGLYDLIARIVHPMLAAPSEPHYDALVNQIAKDINLRAQGMSDISRVLFLVLRKKD